MSISMDTFTQLSLGLLLTGTFVYITVVSRRKIVDNSSTKGKESTVHGTLDKDGMSPRIFIPDVLENWPWPQRIHPAYAEMEKASTAWLASFKAFSPKAQDSFDRGKFSLLASMTYPNVSKEHARAGCDLVNLLFMLDEFTDKSTPSGVRSQKSVVIDAFRNHLAPRPTGEWIGGEISRQFWELNMVNATEISRKRFIQYMDEYLESVVQESIDRGQDRTLNVASYLKERLMTAAMKPAYSIFELGFDIPDDVMGHPAIQEMMVTSGEIVALCNDMISYNVEQMRGDGLRNIITCVMKEHHTDVNGAMLWTQHYIRSLEEKFLAAMSSLPQWEEPLNSQVRKFCDGLGDWVRGNHTWSFESEKYFGKRGLEIKKNKWMSLMPKRSVKEIGPPLVDGSLL